MNGTLTTEIQRMPLHEYKCPAGHITTRIVSIKDANEPLATTICDKGKCRSKFVVAELQASQTGKPILKRGIGGFYSPNA